MRLHDDLACSRMCAHAEQQDEKNEAALLS